MFVMRKVALLLATLLVRSAEGQLWPRSNPLPL
jgi:hypothetical protein